MNVDKLQSESEENVEVKAGAMHNGAAFESASSEDRKAGAYNGAERSRATAVRFPARTNTKLRREATPYDPNRGKGRGRFSDRAVLAITITALTLGFVLGYAIHRRRIMAKQIIVSVNGTIVKQPELMYRLEYLPFNTPTGIHATGIKVMQDILTLILQEQFAEKMKAMPTHEQFKRKFTEVSAATGFAQRLEQSGESLPEFKRRLRIEMAQESLLTQGIKVNEEDIRRYYNLNIDPKNPKALYYHPETATVFVVVTATTEACSAALNELATGVQPASVASHYSILDPAQAPRGILPPIHRGRGELKQIPGLEKAIFKLQINEQTPALVLGGKWWIIRCHNRVPASVDAFEKVREECRHTVALQQGVSDRRLELEKEFAAFRKRANIQLFWQQYAPVVKTIKQ